MRTVDDVQKGGKMMMLSLLIHRGFRLAKDTRGTDLLEFALMGGFVAVAAGAILPSAATSAGTIFSVVAGALQSAAQGYQVGQ